MKEILEIALSGITIVFFFSSLSHETAKTIFLMTYDLFSVYICEVNSNLLNLKKQNEMTINLYYTR